MKRLLAILTILTLLTTGLAAAEVPDLLARFDLVKLAREGQFLKAENLIKAGAAVGRVDKHGRSALHYVAKYTAYDLIELLLDEGAEINAQDNKGWTALMEASYYGFDPVVELLLEYGADPALENEQGWTALMYAAQKGNLKSVKSLLESGADPNHRGGDETLHHSALHGAAANGNKEVVTTLLAGGADINMADRDGVTPLMEAAFSGDYHMVKLFVDLEAELSRQNSRGADVLSYAISGGNADVANLLLKSGFTLSNSDYRPAHPLFTAAEKESLLLVKLLLSKGGEPVAELKEGLLRRAVRANSLEFADYYLNKRGWNFDNSLIEELIETAIFRSADTKLLKELGKRAVKDSPAQLFAFRSVGKIKKLAKESPDYRDSEGRDLLAYAAALDNPGLAAYLVKSGFKVYDIDDKGRSSLHYAAMSGSTKTAKLLLKLTLEPVNKDDEIDLRDSAKRTALSYAVSTGDLELVELLFTKGADLNLADSQNKTALLYSCELGRVDILRYLIYKGAELDLRDSRGLSPLAYATERGDKAMIQLLFDSGAVVAREGREFKAYRTILHKAAAFGELELVKELIAEDFDLNIKDRYGWTPLMLAIFNRNEEIAGLMIEAGADIEAVDDEGWTPLLLAGFMRSPTLVRRLLKSGADVKASSKHGHTFLHMAARIKEYSFFEKALEAEIEFDIQNEDDYTALHYAAIYSNNEAAKRLVEGGAKLDLLNKYEWTPLMYAAERDNLELVTLLVEGGADCNFNNSSDEFYATALYAACAQNSFDVASYLIKQGAEVDAVDGSGWTALMKAAYEGHMQIVKLLVLKGASLDMTNSDGKTAGMLAKDNSFNEIAEYLALKSLETEKETK